MNKRGDTTWTLSELGGILLAIAIILGAFVFLAKGCNVAISNQEKLQAQGTLDQLKNFLDSMTPGQQSTFVIYSPSGYHLTYFNSASNVQCTTNCLCICEDQNCLSDKSYCKDISKPSNTFSTQIGLGSIIITNNLNDYSISATMIDTSETEVVVNSTQCSGALIDIGNGLQAKASAYSAFQNAQKIAAQNNINLTVTSAYRTLQQQQDMLARKGSAIACTPRNTSNGFGANCPHLTGCALDVCYGYLCDQTKDNISPTLNNSDTQLLRQIMTQAGFTSISSEYWHFNYGLTNVVSIPS